MEYTRGAAVALAAHGYRVTNFDYGPPQGWDGDPETRTCLDQVADVVDVMDALNIDTAHAVGFSRGGITAFGLAARHPDRVNDLVLVFPVAAWEGTITVENPQPEQEEGEPDDEYLDRVLTSVFSERFLSQNADAARSLALAPPGTVIRAEQRSDEDVFTADDVVTHPTFIIEGGDDQIVTEEHPARYAEAVAGARHLHVDGASHAWHMEQPDRFARLVAAFVTS
jgi:3-oxoadipate enol-lactonase